ncbi:MAG: ATP-binding protein [Victivallaceae bacterium]|jgi:signal transduction histidine kinase/DNA-binding NarL/FixJ family response regulator
MLKEFNSRLLVIDDEESVRDSFREILCPVRENNLQLSELADAAADFFEISEAGNKAARGPEIIKYSMDEAASGKDALELVKKACKENRPYAAIFVDMRMPEWDGLETVSQIRKVDKRVEVVFVTAYSDHSIEEIVQRAGTNVTYHCKPFSVEEIQQIATKSVYEWNKSRNLEDLITIISDIRACHCQLDSLLQNILGQVAEILGCNSALLAVKHDKQYEIVVAIGAFINSDSAAKYLKSIPDQMEESLYESEDMLYFKLENYDIVTLFERRNITLHRERIYLVQLFLEQAAAAIRNINLQQELVRKEKLSALGMSISMLSHDLRNYIGNIVSLADLAISEETLNPTLAGYLTLIKQSGQDGMEMMNDMLDFVRNKEVVKSEIKMEDLIVEVKRICQEFLDENKVKVKICATDGAIMMGDCSKLCRIICNLMKNAVEAFENCSNPNPEVTLNINTDCSPNVIQIRDNGPGIPKQLMDKLFEPFISSGKAGGTGLGLAIVKQFVEAHKGKIEVESADSGTCFTISIPAK